jgi:hypothetical protein
MLQADQERYPQRGTLLIVTLRLPGYPEPGASSAPRQPEPAVIDMSTCGGTSQGKYELIPQYTSKNNVDDG